MTLCARVLYSATLLCACVFFVDIENTSAATWTEQLGSGARNWYGVASSADGTKLAAIVYGGFIYTSVDAGVTWTQRVTATIADIRSWRSITSSADGTKLAVVVYGGYIYTSSDSGVTWVAQTSAGSRSWGSIASSADGMSLAASVYFLGYIYTSVDGGVTWVQRTSAGSRFWNGITTSSDGTKIAAIGSLQNNYIYTSTDGGVTWVERTSAGSRSWRAITSSSDGMKLVAVYGTSSDGGVFTSIDGGVTWIQRSVPTGPYWYFIDSSSDGLKLIAGVGTQSGSAYAYTSQDGGVTWTQEQPVVNAGWGGVASSADGSRLVGVVASLNPFAPSPGYVWTGISNTPPLTPTITGLTTGIINTTYTYTATATDPNGDNIRYAIDWDSSGTVDEYAPSSGYTSSGTQGQTTHSWPTAGTYVFKVRTEDNQGATSSWATYSVTINNPAPVVLLTASSNTYHAGVDGPITLQWSSSYASSCTGTNFSTSGATSGITTVTPTQTTVYSISCTGTGGTTVQSQTITYVPPSPCVLDGVVIPNGSSYTFYSSHTGIAPATCYSLSQIRTCVNGTLSGLDIYQYATCACTSVFSCANQTTLHDSCPEPAGTNTSCQSGYVCSGGACVGLDVSVSPFGTHSGHLHAYPTILRQGDTSNLYWNVVNAQTGSCTVAGNGQTFTGESSGTSGRTTTAITAKTTYTLRCTGLSGAPFSESTTINTTPTWNEQ